MDNATLELRLGKPVTNISESLAYAVSRLEPDTDEVTEGQWCITFVDTTVPEPAFDPMNFLAEPEVIGRLFVTDSGKEQWVPNT